MKNENNSNTIEQSQSLLPVLDILNNIIKVGNYVSAAINTKLPNTIVNNSNYKLLVNEFTNWQRDVWQQFQVSLVDENIAPQAGEVKKLYDLGIKDESLYTQILNPDGGTTPVTVAVATDLGTMIGQGNSYVQQLETIAKGIEGADKAKIATLDAIISQLNTQFDSMEQEITDKAIDDAKIVFTTYIDVGVAIATEEDPISPLTKGVSQIGENVIKSLEISAEIQATLTQLEAEWAQLDEATIELARIELLIAQLKKVVKESSVAIKSLGKFSNDWQTVYEVTTDANKWKDKGLGELAEWAARMSRVQFYRAVTQTVTA